jgi:hypothetical protein
MVVRTDLNGMLVTNPDGSEPWYLIDRGVRRGIPPGVFPKLLTNGANLQRIEEQANIDRGADWPPDTLLIGSTASSTIWVFEAGTKRGIPSGKVFDYYGFNRSQVQLKSPSSLGTIPDGWLIDPPTQPSGSHPSIVVPGFPLSADAGAARGKAQITVEADGTVHLSMDVSCPLGFNSVTYVATVVIAGWHDDDWACSLVPNVQYFELTCPPPLPIPPLIPGGAGPPVPDNHKHQDWVLYVLEPSDLQMIRNVRVFIDQGPGPDLVTTVINTMKRVGELWDATNSLYVKVKDSELGQDIAVALAAS